MFGKQGKAAKSGGKGVGLGQVAKAPTPKGIKGNNTKLK
jgi:hypothetical protein